MPEIEQVRKLEALLVDNPTFPGAVKTYDYISCPKTSGYRSLHLVFTHKDKEDEAWDGLKVELQLRTGLQHAWATAVETAGTFLRQNLKGGQGDAAWLRFFATASCAIALREDTPLPSAFRSLSLLEIHARLRQESLDLNVVKHLGAYHAVVKAANADPDAQYFLLKLNSAARILDLESFGAHEFESAAQRYLKAESAAELSTDLQVVLVSAGPLKGLLRAYPSYFLDAEAFLHFLAAIIESRQ